MENLSILPYLSLSFSFGLLSLLTPCVFPLIPITVSYFTKRQELEKAKPILDAFLYSFGIILSFTVVGFLIALLFGASGVNRLAANPYINLIIAGIFILFAFNLFGMFEIIVSSNVLTRLSNFHSNNNLLSIWAMAFTFTLTTFTCTMPFIGTVLVSASKGDWFYPIIGMLGYSFAFSIPFFLLALFPSTIKKLPRSGNWMVSFKIILGFLELAAALKFISNADLVFGWGVLSREFFLVIWASLFIGASFYLFGVFYFTHEKKEEAKSALRIFFGIVFLSIALNFLTATNGRSLGELDAYLPPPSNQMSNIKSQEELVWLDNLEIAKKESLKTGKRIFIDFTGYTCTNCRWMEQNIFPETDVKELLSRFILVRLYTDGEEKIHEDNQKYEEDKFGTIALPLYVGMDAEEKVLGQFLGMTRDKEEYKKFLKGLLDLTPMF
ncbi:MAG: thioredoxin family protein [Leptospiraceae bacterium]|nr:thioredoxin family protein [Leptospiraceae bacterium]